MNINLVNYNLKIEARDIVRTIIRNRLTHQEAAHMYNVSPGKIHYATQIVELDRPGLYKEYQEVCRANKAQGAEMARNKRKTKERRKLFMEGKL